MAWVITQLCWDFWFLHLACLVNETFYLLLPTIQGFSRNEWLHRPFCVLLTVNSYLLHFKIFWKNVTSGCLGFNFWQGWEFIHSPTHNGSEVYQHPTNRVQDAFSPEVKELNWMSTALLLLRLWINRTIIFVFVVFLFSLGNVWHWRCKVYPRPCSIHL